MDAIQEFKGAMRAHGLAPPEIIEPGKLHRFPTNGRASDDAGWCKLFPDCEGGVFGDFRSGLSETWQAKREKPFTSSERKAFRQRCEAERRKRKAEEARRHAKARDRAREIWDLAHPAPADHAYLLKKNVQAHGLRVHNGQLVVPMREGEELHSLQYIAPDGDKRFLTGGRVSGCHFIIGDPAGAGPLCIAEGYATAATVHQATDFPVAAAFNSGNLPLATKVLRERFPERPLIVCADDDVGIPGNPGLTKAQSTTGVYLNLGHNKFPEIPKNPTRKQAEEALQKLTDVVKDFPFVEEVDRAVWISALLTTFVRLGLRSAPLFGFTATVMGTGKSLLTDLISIIATGRRATVMSPALDRKEEQKRLLSVLIEGDPVLVVDNIGEPWGSDSMSAILTAETYKDRLLGVNKSITVPTTATWIATGNNLSFAGDLSSRVLVARLDPRCERPDERSFDRDLLVWGPEHRSELVAASLTILAGHVAAGCPTGALRPFGRFEDWSRLVRAAVVWLGMPDPCQARTHIEESDPVKQSLGAVLAAWWACFKGTPKTVGQAVSSGSDELRAALLVVSGEKGAINFRKAGAWLAKYKGRVVDGLRFESAGTYQRSTLWTVASVESGESCESRESSYTRTRADGTNVSGSEQTHQTHQTHEEARDGERETGTI